VGPAVEVGQGVALPDLALLLLHDPVEVASREEPQAHVGHVDRVARRHQVIVPDLLPVDPGAVGGPGVADRVAAGSRLHDAVARRDRVTQDEDVRRVGPAHEGARRPEVDPRAAGVRRGVLAQHEEARARVRVRGGSQLEAEAHGADPDDVPVHEPARPVGQHVSDVGARRRSEVGDPVRAVLPVEPAVEAGDRDVPEDEVRALLAADGHGGRGEGEAVARLVVLAGGQEEEAGRSRGFVHGRRVARLT
jgi:hypothetical protein